MADEQKTQDQAQVTQEQAPAPAPVTLGTAVEGVKPTKAAKPKPPEVEIKMNSIWDSKKGTSQWEVRQIVKDGDEDVVLMRNMEPTGGKDDYRACRFKTLRRAYTPAEEAKAGTGAA